MTRKPLPAATLTADAGTEPGRRRAISLRRIVGGERREFERLYRRHHQEIYRYCLAIVRNREDAEDALQATMTAALRSLPGERRDIKLRPWLFRVAHNEAISIVRGRRPEDDLDEIDAPAAGSAESEHVARERLRELVADLRTLPERRRSALIMRELNGLSYAEIGAALSSSEGAARQAVHEARTALTDIAAGREMDCEEVRRLISARDGRRLRGRRVRSHLGGCDGCTAYAAGIEQRRSDLRALCPPLPAVAASALLGGVLGGGTTSVTLGGAAGGGAAASIAAKGAAVVAAGAIAVGAADIGGVVDVPGPWDDGGSGADRSVVEGGPGAGSTDGESGLIGGSDGPRSDSQGGPGSPGRSQDAPGHDGSPGNSGTAPGRDGSPGSSGDAPGHNGSPGNSGDAPGQDGSPGNSGTAPGQSGSPGNSGDAPGQDGSPGNSGDAPGQVGVTPPGQDGTPPGQPNVPAGQANAPEQGGAPPGQDDLPPGRSG